MTSRPRRRRLAAVVTGCGVIALALVTYLYWPARERAVSVGPQALSRVTFDDGLQTQPAWSPDGRFIAYVSATRLVLPITETTGSIWLLDNIKR